MLKTEETRGEIGLFNRGEGLGESLGEGPAWETSDPGNVKMEVSEVLDHGDILGEHGPDLRDISEPIFSFHSFFILA